MKVLITQPYPTLWDPIDYAPQAPLSTEFSKQEYWSGLPFPPPGDLPAPGIKPWSSALQPDPLPSEPPRKPPLCRPKKNVVEMYFQTMKAIHDIL